MNCFCNEIDGKLLFALYFGVYIFFGSALIRAVFFFTGVQKLLKTLGTTSNLWAPEG
jgi:hypothetical protein